MTIPLAALGRLNAHARAPWAPAKFAIYAYKTLAVHVLVASGDIQVRLVRWTGTCNRCTNGRYWPHWAREQSETVRCRDCAGTGRRTLRFTETTLPDGQVWHHPWEGRTNPGYRIAQLALGFRWDRGTDRDLVGDGAEAQWHPAGEWRPSLGATLLETADLVPLLNEVEDWVEHGAGDRARGADYWYVWSEAKRHLYQQKHERTWGDPSSGYQLDIGDMATGCHVCGTTENLCGYWRGMRTPAVRWCVQVCSKHAAEPRPALTPPEALLTPDIRRWLARHEKVVCV